MADIRAEGFESGDDDEIREKLASMERTAATQAIIAGKAEDAFWAVVAQSYPQIKSGDLDPHTAMFFTSACVTVVRRWVEANSR